MFSSKRIKFDESGRIKVANLFSMIFLQSGGGKDRLIGDIDKFVLKDYHKWLDEETIKYMQNGKNANQTKIINELQNGTVAGVLTIGKELKK